MKQPYATMLKLILLTGAALLLTGLLLTPLAAAPASAPQLSSAVRIESGRSLVTNGERITYTLTFTNPEAAPLTNIQILNQLPANALAEIRVAGGCQAPSCAFVFETRHIPNLRGGGTIPIQVTQAITWFFSALDPGASRTLTFSGRVKCQADGDSFTNQTYLFSDQGNAGDALALTAAIRPAGPGANFSQAPTWCSTDAGGSFDQDWGDFDRDGDLDLAIGSTLGTLVYRNQAGRLHSFWEKPDYTLGVRWVDLDGNGTLELVAVGRHDGHNFIYRYNPDAGGTPGNANNFVTLSTFTTPFQLLRVAPGDYDNQYGPDLVVSAATLNAAPCPVLLYRNNGTGRIGPDGECLSQEASAALAPADFDNDGDLDLALGFFRSKEIRLLANNGLLTASLGLSESILIDRALPFLAYDLAWGDYNRDGLLDLAAAFPLQREARVYRNNRGTFTLATVPLRTDAFLTPRSLNWNDFDGDGRLNLALVDTPPRVYQYDEATHLFRPALSLPASLVGNQIWSLRGLDLDGDTDTDLALSNQKGPALLFTAFTPRLNRTLTPIFNRPASSVAWGDKDADGKPDLLFGAGPNMTSPNLKLYANQNGTFSAPPAAIDVSVGPNALAFGDVDGNGNLEIAATIAGYGLSLYRTGDGALLWSATGFDAADLAWGDAAEDSDPRLDLLVGVRNGPNLIYFNQSSGASIRMVPGWSTSEADNTYSVAWGDFDNDQDLDFAVGNGDQPNRIYRNDGRNNFTLFWSSPISNDTRSVAWADYDGDGDLDLAAANYGRKSYLYENQGLTFTPVWRSPLPRNSVSLAWGDWDNDGDPDLAVGNVNQQDQVYVNQTVPAGPPRLELLWQSAESYPTRDLAWGDKDNDGDLDLAAGQSGGGWNGIYENHAVAPTTAPIPLPNNPSYLFVQRPGGTAAAYYISTAELLAGPPAPNPVEINYTLVDPDGSGLTREIHPATAGTQPGSLLFQYSLNGGGLWQTATPFTPPAIPIPTRSGTPATFQWDALADIALSNQACFRICAFYQNPLGPSRRASACAVSPPFRVRALTCKWPDQATITVLTPHPQPGLPVQLRGDVSGTGSFYYTWNLDGTTIENAQVIQYTFSRPDTYVITLTVTGDPCPVTRPTVVTRTLNLGTPVTGTEQVYLPFILTGDETPAASEPAAAPGPPFSAFTAQPGAPVQVVGLQGRVEVESGTTYLSWQLNRPADQVLAYHIYRSPRRPDALFRLLATVPARANIYHDLTGRCGYVYFVTAVNAAGESPPSRASYQSPGCK